MTTLSVISRHHVRTIPAALKALAAMERELSSATTYAGIRKIIDSGNALKLLFKDVDAVKVQAEDMILAASARIGEELQRVPKAASGRAAVSLTKRGKPNGGLRDAMPSGTSRARYLKLAVAKPQIGKVAEKLRAAGKDATVSAVVRELTQGDKKKRRAARERQLGRHQTNLPDKRYGVIYADPPWRFQPYSRDSGMDRAADNHYPTMTLDDIKSLVIPAAADAVLFLWATVPMLPEALDVMETWGFAYRSHFVWVKDRIGTGYWTRNQHELLLIGTCGAIPAPAPGEQYSSMQAAKLGAHSAKPPVFAEIIEEMFPSLPRLEMFARAPRLGWDVTGNETAP